MRRFGKLSLKICLALIMAGLYWRGAAKQLEIVNTDVHYHDQKAYMNYTRSMYESKYTFIGGRNRMPVYPFLQSLFYRPNLTDEAFFARGKYINLALSLCLLAGLALIARAQFHWLHSLVLTLVISFTVFIFKAGWFQSELLFYFLNFCLFLLMWRLLQQPSWPLAILAGIVAGLAHLTKASILPGLVMFLVSSGTKWVLGVRQNQHKSVDATFTLQAGSHVLGALLVGIFFLMTVLPYINTSKRVFGRYFYNVNSTFYIWYDSWEEAKQGTRAYGDRVGWPDMPPEEIPSLSKYLREHSARQIISRFADGGGRVLHNVMRSYGYFKYVVIYSCLLAAAILWNLRRARQIVTSYPVLCLFLAMYFISYALLYFWYVPIADGNRLILAQFVPLIHTISRGVHVLLRQSKTRIGRHVWPSLTVANLVVLAVVMVDVISILTERVGVMYGGD